MRTLLPGAITEISSPTPMGKSIIAVRTAAARSCAAARQRASISSAAAVIIAVM